MHSSRILIALSLLAGAAPAQEVLRDVSDPSQPF
jgi:hypothetical protein